MTVPAAAAKEGRQKAATNAAGGKRPVILLNSPTGPAGESGNFGLSRRQPDRDPDDATDRDSRAQPARVRRKANGPGAPAIGQNILRRAGRAIGVCPR